MHGPCAALAERFGGQVQGGAAAERQGGEGGGGQVLGAGGGGRNRGREVGDGFTCEAGKGSGERTKEGMRP